MEIMMITQDSVSFTEDGATINVAYERESFMFSITNPRGEASIRLTPQDAIKMVEFIEQVHLQAYKSKNK